MPDVCPISLNGTAWRFHGVGPWGAWLASRQSCIHKFANVDFTMLRTCCLVMVGFTGIAFGLDLC